MRWDVARVPFAAGAAVGRGAGVRVTLPVVAMREPGPRADETDELKVLGLGVTLLSADGRRDLLVVSAGVFAAAAALGRCAEASDMGGEGGSCNSDTVATVDMDLVSGGVVISGELAVEFGDAAKVGVSGMDRSVEMAER